MAQLMPWEEAAQAQPRSLGITKPADPNAAVDSALKSAELTAKARAASRETVMDPLKVDLAKVQIEAAKVAVAKAKQATTGLTAQDRNKLMGQKSALPLVEQRINEIEKLYDENFSATGVGGLKEYLPGSMRPVNQTLDDAANSLLGPLGQAFGITAQQSNTPLELQLRFGPYLPQHGIRDDANRARIQRLREVVANQKAAVAQQLGDSDAPLAAPAMEVATGTTRQEHDPQLSAQLDKAIRAGLSYDQAMAMLPEGTDPIDPQVYARAVGYAKQNPGYKKPLGEVTRTRENNWLQRNANTSGGAYVAGAANALTAGRLDEAIGALGGDTEQANQAKQAIRAEHPVADFVGNATGAGLGAYGIGRIPGVMKAIQSAPKIAPVVSDVLYGTAYGSGEDNENRGRGALTGGGAALLAGPLGRAGVRKLGNVIGGPELQAPVQRLVDQGFVLSPAQRAAGNKTLLGTFRKRVDDALRSSPVVGDAISSQGARQYNQLGRATVEEALAPVGAKVPRDLEGNKLIDYANDQISKAYDKALPDINAPLDPDFLAANSAARASAANLPQVQREMFDTIYERSVTPFIPADGVLSGKALQDIKRGLDKQIMRLDRTQNPADEYLSDELQNLRTVFFDWAERSAPEKVGEFRAANAAFANMVRVNRAAAAAKRDGVFSPDQLLGAIKAKSSDAQFARGNLPMQQLGQDAQQLLPSSLANSGTVDRAIINGVGLSASGGGAAMLPALSPALAVPALKTIQHLPGIDKLLQDLALRRRAAAVRAGQAIRNRQGLGSLATVPLAVESSAVNQ